MGFVAWQICRHISLVNPKLELQLILNLPFQSVHNAERLSLGLHERRNWHLFLSQYRSEFRNILVCNSKFISNKSYEYTTLAFLKRFGHRPKWRGIRYSSIPMSFSMKKTYQLLRINTSEANFDSRIGARMLETCLIFFLLHSLLCCNHRFVWLIDLPCFLQALLHINLYCKMQMQCSEGRKCIKTTWSRSQSQPTAVLLSRSPHGRDWAIPSRSYTGNPCITSPTFS